MKRLPNFLLFAGTLLAQYAPVPSTQYPALESIVNAKPVVQLGAGPPASVACTAGRGSGTGNPGTWMQRVASSGRNQPNGYLGLDAAGNAEVGTAELGTGCPSSYPGVACAKAAPYYASGYRVIDKTVGSTTLGATSVTVTNGAQFALSQQIVISLAGASGADYIGTVTAIGTNTLTITPATTTTVPAGLQVYSTAVTTTSGATASGTSVTLANASSYAAGQGIYIAAAGVAAADYTGTIVAVAANVLTLSPATVTSVATGTEVRHDDTAAIQAAINAIAACGLAGTILLPDGIYDVNGPLMGAGGANARIVLPDVPVGFPVTATNPPLLVQIAGSTPPAVSYSVASYPNAMPAGGVIIRSKGISGNLIGAYSATGSGNFTNVNLALKNINFRSVDNPGQTMMNAFLAASIIAENLAFDTDTPSANISQPTNPNGKALVMPKNGNSAVSLVHNMQATGYYTGLVLGEHGDVDALMFTKLYHGIEIGTNGHTIRAGKITLQGCPYGLYATGGVSTLLVANLEVEHGSLEPAWAAQIADVYDPSNNLQGSIDGWNVTGVTSALLVNSATNLWTKRILTANQNGLCVLCTPIAGVPVNFQDAISFVRTGAQTKMTLINGTLNYGWTVDSGAGTYFLRSNTSAWNPIVFGEASKVTTLGGALAVTTGGSANKAICWKADGKTLGFCSTVLAADGSCTCN